MSDPKLVTEQDVAEATARYNKELEAQSRLLTTEEGREQMVKRGLAANVKDKNSTNKERA